MEQAKIYPLGGEASAKPMQFPDASGVPVNMLPTSDDTASTSSSFWLIARDENLADPDWLGMFAAIGIVKGEPFSPDATTRSFSIAQRRLLTR